METFRMLRVGNRIINLSQVAFAEYSAPSAVSATDAQPSPDASAAARSGEFRPATLIVHFVGGGETRFYHQEAEELNGHFDLLV